MILIYLILLLPVLVIGYLLYRFWQPLKQTKVLYAILAVIAIFVALVIFATIAGLKAAG